MSVLELLEQGREQSTIYVLTKLAIYIQCLAMQSWSLVL